MNSTSIGRRGEKIASLCLVQAGYSIIDTNWKTRWCEIDIIAKKDNRVYFVEVKYRSTSTYGEGFDYIDNKKLQQMTFAAEMWSMTHHYTGDMQLLAASVAADDSVLLLEVS